MNKTQFNIFFFSIVILFNIALAAGGINLTMPVYYYITVPLSCIIGPLWYWAHELNKGKNAK